MRSPKLFQGSHFLQFVLEAARLHFASPDFHKLSVPEQFGPTFFTTIFVRSQVKGDEKCFRSEGPVPRPRGEDDQSGLPGHPQQQVNPLSGKIELY